MKIFSIAIVILCSILVVPAQTKKFRWTTELCEFEGTYDSSKYTEAQFRDTLKLIDSGEFRIETNATPQSFADIKKLKVDTLDKEYNLKLNRLKKLNIVNSKYWETQRQLKIKELEQVYRLSRITMQAYDKPEIIKEYDPAEACVKRFADPLIKGGDELLNIWRQVNEDSRKKNSNPERLRKIFEQEYNSPNKLNYARIEVMTFGWWNCANNSINYVNYDGQHDKNFEKLFKRVKTIYCDEP